MERPDVVGSSATGEEVIILEGKFDAGLTKNQPNSYLSRLSLLHESLFEGLKGARGFASCCN
ncbi:MAG: hypothetical protein O2782_15610, partial [bacterium]|nr:hypothetical protein [bacterium]